MLNDSTASNSCSTWTDDDSRDYLITNIGRKENFKPNEGRWMRMIVGLPDSVPNKSP